ncbi:acetate--CoA ligase family protein [Nisaea acidiphila]|uniref:Acetate--CoA ligase family protein n=1 Tax=Nisaea acidiphila TaxID=1862145 RepID=A0A9J7AW63_9PROT|nr:acetate--CoA ligase family protein [Nisaea acidiphila]UUX51358.1 acetate--CoA ligase family protein [Nisaea acidiphila]
MPASLLQALVSPATIALVGASNTESKLTARPMRFLRRHGFEGRIYPVNPARDTVLGEKAWPSVKAVPEPVDFAYILLDADPAIEALKDCAAAGVRIVAILADGFAEAGEEGARRQAEVQRIAEETGMLVIGPNSMGVVHTASGFAATTNAAFGAETIGRGRLAVISQSGSVIGTLLSRGAARDIAFSTFVSVGNEAAAGIGEVGEILVDHDGTDGFLLFMETIRNRAALARFAAKAHAAGKPVVAYMIGKSEEGQALSVSHTGALTGSAAAVDALLRSLGIRKAEQLETLLEAPGALAKARLQPGRPKTATVIATTGGGGAMVVDQLSARGVEIAGASTSTKAHFAKQGIPSGHGKLVDVTLAGARYEIMKEAVSTLIRDPETGVLIVAIGSSAQFDPELAVKPIVDAVSEASDDAAPVLAFPLPHAPDSMRLLEAGGVPTFRTVESCAETVAMLMTGAAQSVAPAMPLPAAATALIDALPSGTADEVSSAAIFQTMGLTGPGQTVLAPSEGVPEELPVSFPVVAKLVSPDLPHKTDAGAIKVGIKDRAELIDAIMEMRGSAERYHPGFRLAGILVQELVSGLGEALIGLSRDPVAGPVVTVAMGGVMTEIYRDSAVRPAPVSVDGAREMIREVKGFELLRGFRGRPEGDLEALAETVSTLSRLAADSRIEEAEANPVLIMEKGVGVVMLDALIRT